MNSNLQRAYVLQWPELLRWDLKSARAAAFRAAHPAFRPFGEFIEESTEIVHPSREPTHNWPVYGVSNREGVGFSHFQLGKSFNSAYKRIRKDWFFHNPTRANVGSLGRVPDVPVDAITSPEYQVWKIKRGLVPQFVEILIHLPFFLDLIDCHRVGAVKERLFVENLYEIPIPVLTEGDQVLVIDRWHNAQKEIAAARERVRTLEAELPKIVYQELDTPSPPVEEPAGKCLIVLWKDLGRWSFNYVSRATRGLLGFTQSKFPIEPLQQHLAETMNGYSIKPVLEPTPNRMLRLNALQPNGLDLEASKFVRISDRIAERFSIRKGDLFICRSVGSYDLVAKCALAKEDAPNVVFPDTMIRVRFNSSLSSEYVGEVVQTPLGRSFFQSNARTAVGMWKIGADDIESFPIPVPPLPVQHQIIERIESARTKIAYERDAVEKRARKLIADVETQILGT
jgi:type I restriction enzyme S subunit